MHARATHSHFARRSRVVRRRNHRRGGFTLVEILIGATLTLILLGIMIRAFTFAGNEISNGRAVIELSNELRTATDTLLHDLRSATAKMLPWNSLGADEGYFEYLEGPTRDYTFVNDGTAPFNHIDTTLENLSLTSFGDDDDVLMFTARNLEQPYQGIYRGAVIESKVAEIAWWSVLNETSSDAILNADESITIHRRVMLVVPSLNDPTTGYIPGTLNVASLPAPVHIANFLRANDISVRYDATLQALVANSLSDLTKRENRFAHDFTVFPNRVVRDFAVPVTIPTSLEGSVLIGEREGEDVILSNVSGFDVKIYDPSVVIRSANSTDGSVTALMPSDWGYWLSNPADVATPPIGLGGYVDLKYAQSLAPTVTSTSTIYPVPVATPFSGVPVGKSQMGQGAQILPNPASLPAPYRLIDTYYATYCTWSSSYERDAVNQDSASEGGSPIFDEGTNGIDDDGTFGVDDEGERETSPPYPYPVRGIKVTFRVRDPATQQVRQTSVETSFIPE